MAFKTWASGDVLTAADLNAFVVKCQSLYKVVAGQTAYTITATNGVGITVTYGVTFTTIIALLLTPRSNSAIPLIAYMNGAPGLSTAAARVETPGGGNTSVTGEVHWIAIGT